MTYKPFKMRSSPMKRNFGIGEREEVSPTKKDDIEALSLAPITENLTGPDALAPATSKAINEVKDESGNEKKENPIVKEEGLTRGQKVKKGVGSIIMAALDAGGGTTMLADKKAAEKAKKDKEAAEKRADAKSELAHKRAIDLLMVGKKAEKITENPKLSSTGEQMSLIEDYEEGGIYDSDLGGAKHKETLK